MPTTVEPNVDSDSEYTEEEDETDVAVARTITARAGGVLNVLRCGFRGGDKQSTGLVSGAVTPNIKALIITAFLFTLITVVQVFAANIANSKALLMDCISMGVDALTYMGNIIVECRKQGGKERKGTMLICCAISLSCLIYFTYDAGMESWSTVQVCRGATIDEGQDSDDVNGWITLTFGAGGVIFDLLAMWAFARSKKRTGEGSMAFNMFTAALHVGADFMRSSSTVLMSLLILVGGFDSTCLDAYTSLLIGGSIILGALIGIYQWIMLFCSWMRD